MKKSTDFKAATAPVPRKTHWLRFCQTAVHSRASQTLFLLLLLVLLYIRLPSFANPHKPRSSFVSHPPQNEVYMTLFSPEIPPNSSCGRVDFRFEATRLLAYRLLLKPSTRDLHGRKLIVLTTDAATDEQVAVLQQHGAIVRRLAPLGPPPPTLADPYYLSSPVFEFVRLQMWNMTEFSKILYISPETLPLRPLSFVFDTPFSNDAYGGSYLFAAVSTETDARGSLLLDGPLPKGGLQKGPYELFNSGMYLIRPSVQQWLYLNSLYYDPRQTARFADKTELSLLRYAYRSDGPFPWTKLPHVYQTSQPLLADLDTSRAIRDDFWSPESAVDWDLRKFWYFAWGEMRGYYVNRTN